MNMTVDSTRGLNPNRIPISLVTGFLGSGKTTLINHLVNQKGMEPTALIINEFGEIGLDNLLLESAIENTLLLENGCICCSLRGDLIDTICDLFSKVRNKKIPQFKRIIIETTGLADPSPIVTSLQSETLVINRCNIDCVISIVDGVQGSAQLREYEEAVMQVVQANLGLISKSDLCTPSEIGALTDHLNQINPMLVVKAIEHGQIEPANLFSNSMQTLKPRQFVGHRNSNNSDLSLVADGDTRHHDVSSWSLVHESPIDLVRLRDWLSMVYSLRPYQMLRMKGIFRVSQSDYPILLEAVGNVVSPPKWLRHWPDNKPKTRLVVIFKGLSKMALANSFQKHVLL